jgi:hypothetical protein
VAGGLAQAQQQLEGLEGVGAAGEQGDQVGVGGQAQAVVDAALLRVEDDAQDQLGARRELGGDLGLAAAQHERAQLGLQLGGGAHVAGLERAGVAGQELLAPAEQAGVEEVREGPQLEQAVLDRGAGEGDAPLRLQRERGGGGGGGRLFDRLGLVEHDGVPRLRGEQLLIEAEERVAGERDVGALEGAFGAVEQVDREVGPEPGELVLPVVQGAGRGDDEGAAGDRTQGLQGLAEAHVVGQQGADAGVAQQAQPVDAAALVVAQARLEAVRQRGGFDVGEVADERAQTGELRRRRGVERVAQRGGGGPGPARQLAVGGCAPR